MHGITVKMRKFSRKMAARTIKPAPKVARDRSLTGKARIRARKAANKASR